MKEIQVGYTKNLEDGQSVSGQVTYMYPESVEEALQAWGNDVLLSKAEREIVRNIQSICRAAETVEKAQELVSEWLPGIARERQTSGVSKKAILAATKGLSETDLAALIEEIRARKAA